MLRGFTTRNPASLVIPAKAGSQAGAERSDGPSGAGVFTHWIPAFAGMTAAGMTPAGMTPAGVTAAGVTSGA